MELREFLRKHRFRYNLVKILKFVKTRTLQNLKFVLTGKVGYFYVIFSHVTLKVLQDRGLCCNADFKYSLPDINMLQLAKRIDRLTLFVVFKIQLRRTV